MIPKLNSTKNHSPGLNRGSGATEDPAWPVWLCAPLARQQRTSRIAPPAWGMKWNEAEATGIAVAAKNIKGMINIDN
jgi:hypothetical protein